MPGRDPAGPLDQDLLHEAVGGAGDPEPPRLPEQARPRRGDLTGPGDEEAAEGFEVALGQDEAQAFLQERPARPGPHDPGALGSELGPARRRCAAIVRPLPSESHEPPRGLGITRAGKHEVDPRRCGRSAAVPSVPR